MGRSQRLSASTAEGFGPARASFNTLCIQLAERGYVAVTVSYRLAPKYQFPAAVHDVKAAVRWLRANADKYQIDPDRIGTTGGSAGGHLTQFLGVTGGVKSLKATVAMPIFLATLSVSSISTAQATSQSHTTPALMPLKFCPYFWVEIFRNNDTATSNPVRCIG